MSMADPVSASQVLDALRPIIDPDFNKSIVDLGFIKDLKIDGGNVAFSIELTTPACPVKDEFKRAARERVGRRRAAAAARDRVLRAPVRPGRPQHEQRRR